MSKKSKIWLLDDSITLTGRAATLLASAIRSAEKSCSGGFLDNANWEAALIDEIIDTIKNNNLHKHRQKLKRALWYGKQFRG